MLNIIKTKSFKITAALLALVLCVTGTIGCAAPTASAAELSIGDAKVASFRHGDRQRAITDGKLVGADDGIATMSVFITDGSDPKYNANNVMWEHDGTGWASDSAVLFEGAGSQQQIYACSPYNQSAADGKVTVTATDQTDWLVATSKPLTSGKVELTMTHALSKLVLNPTFGTELTNQTIANIEIGGMYASGDLNIADNTWSNLSEANATLTMRNNEALVIPIDCESFTVTITMADGRVFTTTVDLASVDNKLEAGTQYNIGLQVGQDKVTLGGITAESWGIPIDGGNLSTE